MKPNDLLNKLDLETLNIKDLTLLLKILNEIKDINNINNDDEIEVLK